MTNLKNVIEDVFEDVNQGNIELIDMVKIYAYFSYFSRKGLIDYDIKTLKSIFFNGMNMSSLKSKYCEDVEEELSKIAIEQSSSSRLRKLYIFIPSPALI